MSFFANFVSWVLLSVLLLFGIFIWYYFIRMFVLKILLSYRRKRLIKKIEKFPVPLFPRGENIYSSGKTCLLTNFNLKRLNEYCKLVKAYESDPLIRFHIECMQEYKPGGRYEPLPKGPRHKGGGHPFFIKFNQEEQAVERKNNIADVVYRKPVTLPSFEFGVKFITDTYRYIYVKISYWYSNEDRKISYPQEALYLGKAYLDMLCVVSEAINDFVRRYGITCEFQFDTVSSGYSRFTEKEIKRAVKIIDFPEFKLDETQT